ncbi:hypothetical protein PGT21_028355 [Puccinia graminis f. sp. tritici]|uniref:Ubinuclein middle domain-containing protein n=2 Tax=Puccinia graminis f. sp. tritici TaxID=56615 RepID=E3KH19_PUCGT|nr:uncharacterized protein PGTG_09307 [Puccinia graminis f. sp. tritici CRL 75-36-700-3]EFP83594.1 hypothetical protein PGTG_09307 [Puccinia graminis f. sp. tritici CRL 75-36-700-3]KAA1066319.1 hypothetical protein PGT21_028355 [Puccinia graminis f. sp. tritici]KAA1128362.1 hypothetical protein PGTUg99_014181 [Puccinia graminis f. sp. tritici]
MDSNFIARLEREARAKQGLSPPAADADHSIHPPLSSESNQSDHIRSRPHQAQDHEDTELEYVDWDEDEALRMIGEVQEEVEDHPPTHLDSIGPHPRPSTSHEPSDDRDPDPPNEEAEDDDDDGTTDSDLDEIRPKKPDPIPTIRLTLALDLQLPLEKTVEHSVTFLAKQAGYILPADTAITFGASAVPEPEQPPPAQKLTTDTSLDIAPPPKRRRRRRIQERDEGYDKDDPFVDDSEAFIIEPKYYHPPARDGFFVVLGPVELKADSKQTRVRKPKKPPLGGVPDNSSQPGDASTTKRRIPLNSVPQSSSTLPTLAAQSTSQLPKPPQAKQSDSDPFKLEGALPSSASVPNNAPQSTSQPPKPVQKPQPSTSQAPSSGTARPADIRPISHGAQTSHSNSPKPINGEAHPASTQAPLKPVDSPGVFSATTPRQRPVSTQRHSGTPHDPIYLCDDEERQTATPSSSKLKQAPTHKSEPPTMAVAGPSNHTSRPARPPYLKARSLSERKSAGPLPRPLEDALDSLNAEIQAVSPFVPKKFPNELKPSTLRVAQMALDMNEYDECFFIRLAQLFPYNTFTIKKFVKREILPQRKAYYESQINERIGRLKQMVIEGMPAARADYEAALLEYEKAQRAWRESRPEEPSGALPTNASTILADTIMKNPVNPFEQTPTEPADKPPKPPLKTFKLNTPMREIIYELIKLEDELCETIKDTQKIVDKNVTLKDTSNRRQFYLRLSHLWPDDFMTTQKLSREVAYMKRKMEGNSVDPQNLITLQ